MCAVGNDGPHFHLVNEGKGEKNIKERLLSFGFINGAA